MRGKFWDLEGQVEPKLVPLHLSCTSHFKAVQHVTAPPPSILNEATGAKNVSTIFGP